jgi:hypothetical protein
VNGVETERPSRPEVSHHFRARQATFFFRERPAGSDVLVVQAKFMLPWSFAIAARPGDPIWPVLIIAVNEVAPAIRVSVSL